MPRCRPCLQRLGLLLAQTRVAGHLERLVERLLVLAGVVMLAGQGREWELLRLDEVDPPHLGRVESALVGDQIHHPLEVVGRFRPPRAAIGAVRHRVGVDAEHFVVEVRDRHRGRST